ncbi:MAG TPA: nucleotidyl transferase AbiEii/AbiGii toxin family protein [Kofleriaceae bacterium]|nr:nucleotidyl transferase AbiEii/AbiGii toxin family protein [Kofleriaceae bacterium]
MHLDHRTSRDLDFFATTDPTLLLPTLEALPGVVISDRASGTVHLVMDGVPVTLLEYRYPLLAAPVRFDDVPVPIASLVDLACMKLSAIASRGAARDFWDLHAVISARIESLGELLAAFQTKFAAVDVGHVVRSLVYFGDADAEPLPGGLTAAHWTAVKRDLERWVRALQD